VRGGARQVSPTIPDVWAVMRDPAEQTAVELRVRRNSVPLLREMIRPVTDALGGMVRGSLAGVFDAATTVRPDFAAPVQTVDLSRMADRGDEMNLASRVNGQHLPTDAAGPRLGVAVLPDTKARQPPHPVQRPPHLPEPRYGHAPQM
jgi:hypothetical protein